MLDGFNFPQALHFLPKLKSHFVLSFSEPSPVISTFKCFYAFWLVDFPSCLKTVAHRLSGALTLFFIFAS